MKRLMLSAALALAVISASAQQRHSGYTLPDTPKRAAYTDYSSLDRGFWCAVQLTPAITSDRVGRCKGLAQADVVAGYRFNEFFRVGLGISPGINAGTRIFPKDGGGPYPIYSMPIYADVRGNIISQESRMAVPYWSVDAGYTINDGIYLSPTMGVRFGSVRNNLLVGLTYIFQRVGSVNSYNAAGLRLGFEF